MTRVSMAAALVFVALSAESLAQSVAIELNPAQQAQIKEFISKHEGASGSSSNKPLRLAVQCPPKWSCGQP